jgi:hypothetical protein
MPVPITRTDWSSPSTPVLPVVALPYDRSRTPSPSSRSSTRDLHERSGSSLSRGRPHPIRTVIPNVSSVPLAPWVLPEDFNPPIYEVSRPSGDCNYCATHPTSYRRIYMHYSWLKSLLTAFRLMRSRRPYFTSDDFVDRSFPDSSETCKLTENTQGH